MSERDYSDAYRDEAKNWLKKAILVSLIGGILNLLFYAVFSGLLLGIYSFVIYVSVLVINIYLLFQHIDTLILKRIAQQQGEKNA